MPNPDSRDEWECLRCNDTGFKVGTYILCPCTTGSNEYAPSQQIMAQTMLYAMGTEQIMGVTTGHWEGTDETEGHVVKERWVPGHPFLPLLSVIDGGPSRVCGVAVNGSPCMKRKDEHDG